MVDTGAQSIDSQYVDSAGAIAFSDKLITALNKKVDKLAPIKCYPGEFENEGLALGALRVIRGEEQAVKIEKE